MLVWWNGIHTRLKILRPNRACGFESHHQHHLNGPCDTRRFRIMAEQDGNVADPLHQGRVRPSTQIFNHLLASIPILGVDPNLDEFMVVKRLIDLQPNGRGNSVVADDDYRLAMMS